MLKYVAFCALFAAAFAGVPENPDDDYIQGSVEASSSIIAQYMQLHDVTNREIRYKPGFFLEYDGLVNLTDGRLNDINTYTVDGNIKRLSGNKFEVPLTFTHVDFQFKYEAQLAFRMNNEGFVDGNVANYEMVLPIEVRNGKYELMAAPKFFIPNVTITFSGGNQIMDFFYNAMRHAFRDVVRQLNEQEYAHKIAQLIVNAMNASSEKN